MFAKFHTNPWDWEVGILHGPAEAANAWIEKRIGVSNVIGTQSEGHCYFQENIPIIIWMKDINDIPVLAHEVLHAVFAILESRGLLHCDSSEEAYTYTLSNLLGRILACKEWKRV